VIWPFVIAGLEPFIEVEPLLIALSWVVRINSLKSFGRWSRKTHQLVADRAMAAEDALLHAQLLHLLQDCGSRADISPNHDRVRL
jgi:hypothetical protein